MTTVLSYTNAYPGAAFPQHLAGQTTTVQNYRYPGAVQPAGTTTVLSYSNAYPNAAFAQHLAGQTLTVQNFLYPGAVQPIFVPPPPPRAPVQPATGSGDKRKRWALVGGRYVQFTTYADLARQRREYRAGVRLEQAKAAQKENARRTEAERIPLAPVDFTGALAAEKSLLADIQRDQRMDLWRSLVRRIERERRLIEEDEEDVVMLLLEDE